MAFNSNVGLLFKISAQDDASTVIKNLSSVIDRETSLIGSKGTAELDKLTNSSKGLGASLTSLISPVAVASSGIAAIGAAAVGVGSALFAIAKNASDLGSQIHDLSVQTGLGAESISTLKFAADQAGSSIEAVAGGLTIFEKNVGKAAEGGKQATETMKRLGIDPKAAINDLDGALAQVFKRISELKPGVEQTKAATDAFGRSGASLIGVINDVGGNFDEFKRKAKELGVVLTDEDARAADDFGDTLDTLKAQAQGIAFQFAKGFMPAITQAMSEISGSLSNNKSSWQQWGEIVGGVILRLTRGTNLLIAAMKDIGSGSYLNTAIALQENAEGYKQDERRKAISAVLADPNRPNFLKQQDKDIQRVANTSDDYLENYTKNKAKKTKFKKEDFELSSEGKALVEAGNRLGISPLDLASIISYETGGTFSSKIKGGKGGNYTGLIQFGKPEAAKYDIKNNNTFEKQLLNAVVPFFKDRFASVGRSTQGASILDLYKTVNGGNPNVSSRASDGNGTIAQHVEKILRQHQPKALAKFFGGKESNIESDKIGSQIKKSLEDEKRLEKRLNEEKEKLRADYIKSIEDEYATIGKLSESAAKTELVLLEDRLKRQLISEEEYARAVGAIKLASLDREREAQTAILNNPEANDKERLDAINALKIIDDEYTAQRVENAGAIGDAVENQVEKERRANEELLQIRRSVLESERELTDFRAQQERKTLENTLNHSFGKDRIDALVVLREFDIREAERQRERQDADAKTRLDRDLADLETRAKTDAALQKRANEEKLELDKLYKNALLLSDEDYQAQKKAIEDRYNPQIQTEAKNDTVAGIFAKGLGDLVGGGVDPTNQIKTQAEYVKAVYGDLKDTAADAIGSMVQGLGQMAAAWIQTGKFSGKAALQMASSVLIGIAVQAGTKALFELAEGYAALATLNPVAAALHFTAAGIYGTIAGATAGAGVVLGLASRAVGGGSSNAASSAFRSQTGTGNLDLRQNQNTGGRNSSSSPSSGTSGGAYSSESDARIREEERFRNRDSQATAPVEHNTLTLQIPSNFIEREVISKLKGRGELHKVFIELIDA